MSDEANGGMTEAVENFLIATKYESGTGGKPKDLEQAFFYMTKAAQGGHCQAAYNVCAYYFHGRGTARDLERARAWALKVRELGAEDFADRALAMIDAKELELKTVGQHTSTTTAQGLEADKSKCEPSKASSSWPPILFIGSMILLVYVAGEIEKNNRGSGRLLIGWVFGLGALGVFFNIIWGRTVKQTIRNFGELLRAIMITLLGALLLAGIGFCSNGGHLSDTIGDLPDNVRKP